MQAVGVLGGVDCAPEPANSSRPSGSGNCTRMPSTSLGSLRPAIRRSTSRLGASAGSVWSSVRIPASSAALRLAATYTWEAGSSPTTTVARPTGLPRSAQGGDPFGHPSRTRAATSVPVRTPGSHGARIEARAARPLIRPRQYLADHRDDRGHRVQVVALRDHDVGIPLRRLHEPEVHRPHRLEVLLAHRLERPAPVLDVAAQAAHHPEVGVGVDVDLEVHQPPQLGLVEHQDPLDDQHRDAVPPERWPRRPVVHREVVGGPLDAASGQQFPQMLHQQAGLQRVGVVVVDLGPFLEREMGEIQVVGVVLDQRHVLGADLLHDLLGDGGLARPGASGEPDDQRPGGRPLEARARVLRPSSDGSRSGFDGAEPGLSAGRRPPRRSGSDRSTTVTPTASSASCLAWAVPLDPLMMAPAWPIFLPGGAVTPAM